MTIRKLTKQELKRAIDNIIEYEIQGLYSGNLENGLKALYLMGIPPYKDYNEQDIADFLFDNDHLTLEYLIN